ncbi:MAG: 50S ribosome-binding GTPase [Candidatus Eisenbacteria bacterium]|nr:50S ribosome-binding GTPase [Candidatus Eisenbacteria bacterium]
MDGLLKEAKTPEEKLPILREMLRVIPKHKGTDKMQADLKRRISKFQEAADQRGKAGGRVDPFHVPTEWVGQVVLAGPPNSGKSSILDILTSAKPAIADFPFTTVLPQPGMVPFEDIQIQLVDAPPLARESLPPGIFNLYRTADLIVIAVDLTDDDPVAQAREIINLLDERLITLVDHRQETLDPSRDARVHRRAMIFGCKADEPGTDEKAKALAESMQPIEVIKFSCLDDDVVETIPGKFYKALRMIRIHTKKPGYKFIKSAPYILPAGSTIMDAAKEIHKDFAEQLKEARVWGSAKHDGQAVMRDHILADKDIVEFHV